MPNNQPKRIRLRWRDGGIVISEECWLVNEDSDFHLMTDHDLVNDENLRDLVVSSAVKNNMVLFEDDEGVFALPAENVLEITYI